MRPLEVLHLCGLHPAGQPVVSKVADLSLGGCFVKMPRPHWAQEPTSLVRAELCCHDWKSWCYKGVAVKKPPLLKKLYQPRGRKMSTKIENVVYRAS